MAVINEPRALRDGIGEALSAALGYELTVGEPRQLTGGASRQTWAADAHDAQGRSIPVVLRRDPPGQGDADRMRAWLGGQDVPIHVVAGAPGLRSVSLRLAGGGELVVE